MKLKAVVVDTNLIFSSLIPKFSKIREKLFESELSFYSPNFLITEIYKHKDKLILSVWRAERGLITLCRDIDVKDTPLIALAIELNVPVWTGDKKLKEGLKSKGFNKFFEI